MKLELPYHTRFGERIVFVGSEPKFGNWNPRDGVVMTYTDGGLWRTQIDLPIGHVVEYKFLVVTDTNCVWEPCAKNHKIYIHSPLSVAFEVDYLTIQNEWNVCTCSTFVRLGTYCPYHICGEPARHCLD